MNFLNGGFLEGKKTYITTAIGILSAIGAYLTGDMTLPELIQTAFPLGGIFFLRKGINISNTKEQK